MKVKDIATLKQKTKPTGAERVPVSATEYLTVEQIGGAGTGSTRMFNIQTSRATSRSGAITLSTIIEGVNADDLARLSDPSKYRLCLMRHRASVRRGRSWHISALPYFKAARTGTLVGLSDHRIPEAYTWWPVTGRKVPWFGGANVLEVLPYSINLENKCFKNSKNIKMLDGVALFEYTGRGGEGWTRISNIAYVESFLCCRKNPEKTPFVSISVKI